MRAARVLILAAAVGASAAGALADVVSITASRDNTLYEDFFGTLSNGQGEYLFSGRTLQSKNSLRRALVRFDVAAAVPAGSTITGVTLRMTMSRGISDASAVTLHRVLADWGEGGSDALDEEGNGAAAQEGDATWDYRFYATQTWTNRGGDFVDTLSAMAIIGGIGDYEWASTALTVADVQGWLDAPSGNFGWVLVGDEQGTPSTAKRFNSRENADVSSRPRIIVEYTPVPAPGAAWVIAGAATIALRRRR
ncbi:MAG: DNRLRE domain-containing protein [Phycisphaeraceae bacterium]|nr:DNRLRE domain-containing protein [Phycisphaeraceae bacterium]